jgi:hypothetical protein
MDEPERAELIDNLVSSVVSGFQNWKSDFTDDLVLTFKHGPPAVTFDEARKEWHRYVDYRRAIDLRKARNEYHIHRNEERLAEDFMVAYYESDELKKKFDRK